MKRSLGFVLLFLVAVCLYPTPLRAQDVSAVTGVVTDTSGAAIVGADISLVNTTTSAIYHAKTNSVGSYTIVNVAPGPGYKITISQSGFEPLVVTDIYLTVASTRTQNAKLQAGEVSQSVEVSASNSEVTIDTTDATVGNNFDGSLLNQLPVQDRDTPAVLFTLQPGITDNGAVTGARTDQSYVTVDGLDVNDISIGQTFLIVANAPVDSVEEFRGTVGGELVSSSTGGGGQFQLVTRGGTNAFHGDLNEYHRDTSTEANYWFNNNVGVPRAPLIRNQFGGRIGGPVLKDKLFFFFDFNDSRIVQSLPEDTTVPLDPYRNGDVAYILENATDGSGACSDASRANTTPQCIGTLTPAQVKTTDPLGIGYSSVIQTFLNARYPHANDLNSGDGVNTGGYRFTAPNPDDETNYVGRIDYKLSDTMKLFGRVTITRENAIEFPVSLPTDPVSNPFMDRSYGYVVGHTWTIGATKVNSFYYGDTIEKYDFPALYAPTGTTSLTFGDGANAFLGDPYNTYETQKRRIPIPVVRDDFNWQKGTHSLIFGGSFKFIKTESQQIDDFNFLGLGLGGGLSELDPSLRPADIQNIPGDPTAAALYDNAFTFALGHIGSVDTNYNYNAAGVAFPNGTGHLRRYRYYQTELYAGDTWKVTKDLTLTYGLRYQYYSVPYEVSGAESIENFGFNTYFADRLEQSAAGISGDSSVPFITYYLGGKANNAGALYEPNYKDFAPRVAFAYGPSFLSKTVINGGAGIVYDRTVINALNFIQDQSSYLFQNSTNTEFGTAGTPQADLLADPRVGTNFAFPANTPPAITKPLTPFVSGGTPYGLPNFETNSIIDPNLKDPYSIAFNMGVQQELPANFVLKVSYVGRLGRRLLAQADASQLIDFPDSQSGQELSTAFGNLTQEIRAGQPAATPQPWFEDQIGPGWTEFLYGALAQYVANGDFADFTQAMAVHGLLNSNVGMASQFSENTFYTNKGFSSYNGLLTTLSKNLSHGVRFDFNYTWSHSIDNTSLIANAVASATGIGFICDAARPRECRGNSDFDETHVINADFNYDLPIGTGKTFASTAPRWADEIIGGWSVSGIPQWHSGLAFTAFSNAYVAGFANDAPGIFNGDRAAVQGHVHKNSDGTVNLFTSSSAADATFSGPVGFTIGSRNNLRGPSAWGMDAGLAKRFPLVSDRVSMIFRADAFNVFNHPTFATPAGTDITEESGIPFGQIDNTTGSPRVLQLALRMEF